MEVSLGNHFVLCDMWYVILLLCQLLPVLKWPLQVINIQYDCYQSDHGELVKIPWFLKREWCNQVTCIYNSYATYACIWLLSLLFLYWGSQTDTILIIMKVKTLVQKMMAMHYQFFPYYIMYLWIYRGGAYHCIANIIVCLSLQYIYFDTLPVFSFGILHFKKYL